VYLTPLPPYNPWVAPMGVKQHRDTPVWAVVTFSILAAIILADLGSKTLSYGPMPLIAAVGPLVVLLAAGWWIGGRGLNYAAASYCLLWGGLVAVTGAGVLNSIVDALVSSFITPVDGMTWPAVIIAAPIFEEVLKTQPVRRFAKRETKQKHTMIAYVWMSAAGFAFIENIGYFTESLNGEYSVGFGEIVVLRSLLSLFAHVSFSTPAAIGAAAGGWRRWFGLAISVALHASWNGMALSDVPLLNWYVTGALPVFAVILSVVCWQRIKGERRVSDMIFNAGVVPGVTEPIAREPMVLNRKQKRAKREWQSASIRVLDAGWTLENLQRASAKRRAFAYSLIKR
jgi:RsiW-degrading membrane proteinase PrsW (M82 family)